MRFVSTTEQCIHSHKILWQTSSRGRQIVELPAPDSSSFSHTALAGHLGASDRFLYRYSKMKEMQFRLQNRRTQLKKCHKARFLK